MHFAQNVVAAIFGSSYYADVCSSVNQFCKFDLNQMFFSYFHLVIWSALGVGQLVDDRTEHKSKQWQ